MYCPTRISSRCNSVMRGGSHRSRGMQPVAMAERGGHADRLAAVRRRCAITREEPNATWLALMIRPARNRLRMLRL